MQTDTNTRGHGSAPEETPQRLDERPGKADVRPSSPSVPPGVSERGELADRVNPWARILAHVVVEAAPNTPPFRIEKRHGSITLSKEWSAQHQTAIWTKTYQPQVTAGSAQDLSFLCEWENTLLTLATQANVSGCVRLLDHVFTASPLHSVDTSVADREHRTSRIRTFDAGPTLDIWELMTPRVEGHPQAHPFVEQRNYLKLIRGTLNALQDFHAKGFTHCDLHPGNIALPVRRTQPQTSPERGGHILLEPLWDEIRIIDLDFSASRSIVPPVRPPHQLMADGSSVAPMSDHLRVRLLAIDNWLKEQGQDARCYDREFWACAEHAEHLECFRTLDWREDLYQLGFWLAQIRDRWGGAAHVSTTSAQREVNRFITSFPEELMAWGSRIEADYNPNNLAGKSPTRPHDAYIGRIDSLLRQSGEGPNVFVLLRTDHDTQLETLTIGHQGSDAPTESTKCAQQLRSRSVGEHWGTKVGIKSKVAPRPLPYQSVETDRHQESRVHFDAPEMVVLPKGSFLMGASDFEPEGNDDERPQHRVCIEYPFAIGKYPITFSQWDLCLTELGVTHRPYDKGWGRSQRPVINVSWHDALAYLAWLNTKMGLKINDPHRYRLPSEAEWEYACRAGTSTPFSTLNGLLSSEEATFSREGGLARRNVAQAQKRHTQTAPVETCAANPWGLHGMHGNVWEWVQDSYRANYQDAPADGSAVQSNSAVRVLRGGCWDFSEKFSRSASRNWNRPDTRNKYSGFRVARTLP